MSEAQGQETSTHPFRAARLRGGTISHRPVAPALVGILLALAAPGGGATVDHSCAGTAGPTLLEEVNALRRTAGRAPLVLDQRLCRVAAELSGDALHGRSEGSRAVTDVSRRLRAESYQAFRWRKKTQVGAASVRAFLEAWRRLDPAGFEEDLLGDYEHLGLGVELHFGGPAHVLLLGLEARTEERRRAAPLSDREGTRSEILRSLNALRLDRGLGQVLAHPDLDRAAQGHADDMLRGRFYRHVGSDGSRVGDRVQRAGYRFGLVAENIARGLYAPGEVVERWMSSRQHRGNMLHPAIHEIGVGSAVVEEEDEVTVYWVLVLARPQ